MRLYALVGVPILFMISCVSAPLSVDERIVLASIERPSRSMFVTPQNSSANTPRSIIYQADVCPRNMCVQVQFERKSILPRIVVIGLDGQPMIFVELFEGGLDAVILVTVPF